MDPGVLLIIIAVAFVFGIYFLRYILNNLMNKGFDAVGNSVRKSKNAKRGPEIVRLADMYPDIAVRHYQEGTAYEINPVLMTAENAAAVAQANPYVQAGAITYAQPQPDSFAQQEADVQTAAYEHTDNSQAQPMTYANNPFQQPQINPYAQMGANPYAQANPYISPEKNEEYIAAKKAKREKILKIFANIVAIVGLVENIVMLIGLSTMALPIYIRNSSKAGSNYSFSYQYGILKTVILLIVISVAAYAVLFFSKKILYTAFYPILSFVIAIMFLAVTSIYIREYKINDYNRYGYVSVPEYIMREKTAGVLLVFAALAIIILTALYILKGYRWTLWAGLLIGAGATVCGIIDIAEIVYKANGLWLMAGNYLGYPLLILLYSLSYKDKNKPLLGK